MNDLVVSAQRGDLSRFLDLSPDEQAKLHAARPWFAAEFRVTCPDNAPFMLTQFECQAVFGTGAEIWGDVQPWHFRGIRVRVP
jgi:hypothetical protein